MISELHALVGSIILGFVQLFLADFLATRKRGLKWNMSSREGEVPPLVGIAGRAERAFHNFKETFPLFLGALVALSWSESFGEFSRWGATLYLLGRLIYLPLYLGNVIFFRSMIWLVSIGGIGLILLELVL